KYFLTLQRLAARPKLPHLPFYRFSNSLFPCGQDCTRIKKLRITYQYFSNCFCPGLGSFRVNINFRMSQSDCLLNLIIRNPCPTVKYERNVRHFGYLFHFIKSEIWFALVRSVHRTECGRKRIDTCLLNESETLI